MADRVIFGSDQGISRNAVIVVHWSIALVEDVEARMDEHDGVQKMIELDDVARRVGFGMSPALVWRQHWRKWTM
jgi:hypothetical protein